MAATHRLFLLQPRLLLCDHLAQPPVQLVEGNVAVTVRVAAGKGAEEPLRILAGPGPVAAQR